jgi:hypothetical protein
MVKPARPITLSTWLISLCPLYPRWPALLAYTLLLFNVGNVLLCVIYQLNFIIGVYVNEKLHIYIYIYTYIYRVRYHPRFRASTVGLGMYHPRIRGDYCIFQYDCHNLFTVCSLEDHPKIFSCSGRRETLLTWIWGAHISTVSNINQPSQYSL